jgi:sec-independent protein translocase protein TatB
MVFNLSGSELVFLLLIALVVLGPEKLPEAVRKFGKTYGEFKKMTSGFQSELRNALDEPMKEMRETADAMRKAANFDFDAAADDGAPSNGMLPGAAAVDTAAARPGVPPSGDTDGTAEPAASPATPGAVSQPVVVDATIAAQNAERDRSTADEDQASRE